jgi:hypothetical protein
MYLFSQTGSTTFTNEDPMLFFNYNLGLQAQTSTVG